MEAFKNKYFGDKKFYIDVLALASPIVIQQLITNFVNMLDNIMVGQVGTYAMSGVSISNQLISIFILAIFGLISAASIYGAQFVGKKDEKNVRNCLYYKLISSLVVCILAISIVWAFGDKLIGIFMNENSNSKEAIEETYKHALTYLRIMSIGFIPFAFSESITSSFRENKESKLPMYISMATVATNFVFNWILIFGNFGFPALGPAGAAIATVISRFVELFLNIMISYRSRFRFTFLQGFFSKFHIDKELFKEITRSGVPLIVNELLYSTGLAAITHAYSFRGIDAIAAYNIVATIINLFFVFALAMGSCISILVGQRLGAGDIEDAVETNTRLTVLALIVSIIAGLILAVSAKAFPQLYNTSEYVKDISTQMIRIGGLTLWISSLYNTSYYTLRCGGKTIITLLFDSVGTLFVSLPVAYLLAIVTDLDIVSMYLIIRIVDLYKVFLGLYLVKKRIWVNNLVDKKVPI